MTVELVRKTGDPDLDRWLAERLAEAPPLSDAQRDRLGRLLGGGRQ